MARRSGVGRWVGGLVGAVLVNAVLLGALSFQVLPQVWRTTPREVQAISLDLAPSPRLKTPTPRPTLTRQTATPKAPAAPSPLVLRDKRAQTRPSQPSPSVAAANPAQASPAQASPAQPALAQPAPTQAAAPAPASSGGGDDTRAKVGDALRRLGGCSSFSPQGREDAPCRRDWAYADKSLDTVPADKRAMFAADKSRNDDMMATAIKLRRDMPPPPPMSLSDPVHYGCTFIGGKRRCSTY